MPLIQAAKIILAWEPTPIPLRDFDWVAYCDSYGSDIACGYGKTPGAAVEELMEALEQLREEKRI